MEDEFVICQLAEDTYYVSNPSTTHGFAVVGSPLLATRFSEKNYETFLHEMKKIFVTPKMVCVKVNYTIEEVK